MSTQRTTHSQTAERAANEIQEKLDQLDPSSEMAHREGATPEPDFR
jgi:hypothetical protein